MKTRLLAIALAVPLTMASLSGFAGEGDKSTTTPTGATFDTLDANKDGRISMPEASADPSVVESFSTADKNGDGYLDSSEYQASTRKPQR